LKAVLACGAPLTELGAQCVEIMSDDQSMLLKRHGSGESTAFEYRPKVSASLQLPPLPVFKRVVCRTT
jgi:hypothetical protein